MKKLLSNMRVVVKRGVVLLFIVMLPSCASTRLINSWKNPEHNFFKPQKLLVVGVTPNYDARKAFEFELITHLNARNIIAIQSAVVFDSSFTDSKQTVKDIEAQVDALLANGYDSVLISAVKSVSANASYGSDSTKTDYHLRRFALYYLAYQEAYFKQDPPSSYKVITVETSLYHLDKATNTELIWQGSFDLVDPYHNDEAMEAYTKKLIKILEREKIIPRL
ncbi:hypothetical protein OAC43_00655 [Flavobacteriaceae bacterium]|nr:hypothetical protein [Algibacter sp.]MDA9070136.1 hypothetical protein [Algibacter sp.]MDB9859200.1 hypothetical protein [Flavobacteriaceae bacterium]